MSYHAYLWTSLAAMAAVMLAMIARGKVPIRYNLRNLLVRWRVTALSALAFTVIVGLLTVMLAFVNGMYALTEGSGQPGNVIVLAGGATDEMFSSLAYGDISNIEREKATLDENDQPLPTPVGTEQVRRGSEWVYLASREVYMVINQPIPRQPGEQPRRRFVQVRGIVDPEIAGLVHGLSLLEGTWFSEAGVRTLARGRAEAIEAVLGEGVARELGRDKYQGRQRLQVGDTFELGDRTWVVVGVMASAGSTFDSEVWARQPIVAPMFRKENYSTLVLRTRDADSARILAYHLRNRFKPAVEAQPEREYYAKLSTTNQQFLGAIVFVAVVMAVGGIFGIMNTMFAAIAQRTRDIGVLRILGYRRWQILVSFLLESMLIALAGGLVGCALGSLANGWTASSIVSGGQGGGKSIVLKLVVDASILGTGLLFALVMGVLGGLLPAWSAMRLKPLESVR
ncbi:MAG: ABC transporter permease [Gemmataceae bacterium]|nr:ABC transporter permease [Gemmataceae bacterium]MDW8265546.1 ABC transporter permease [Gemmataceae bacterium]